MAIKRIDLRKATMAKVDAEVAILQVRMIRTRGMMCEQGRLRVYVAPLLEGRLAPSPQPAQTDRRLQAPDPC